MPAMSAGVVFPARSRLGQRCNRIGQLSRSVQPVRILDVRHDQPTVGGRGNPQIDVVLQDNLARRIVPAGVDLGGEDQPQQDYGFGDERQRRDPAIAEVPPSGAPALSPAPSWR